MGNWERDKRTTRCIVWKHILLFRFSFGLQIVMEDKIKRKIVLLIGRRNIMNNIRLIPFRFHAFVWWVGWLDVLFFSWVTKFMSFGKILQQGSNYPISVFFIPQAIHIYRDHWFWIEMPSLQYLYIPCLFIKICRKLTHDV